MSFEALKKARESHDSIDFYSYDGVKCPHCGHLHNEQPELPWAEDVHDWECESCGEEFVVVVRAWYSWDTSEADEE